MRFVLRYLVLTYCVCVFSQAAEAQYRNAPWAPSEFAIEKVSRNVGNISAMGSFGSDLIMIGAEGRNLLRLQDRNEDHNFDRQFEYLVGFDGLSDLAITNTQIYVSDRSGVWRSEIGRTLQASNSPAKIYSISRSRVGANRPLALDPSGQTLYIGIHLQTPSPRGHIIALDLIDNTPRVIASGAWQPLSMVMSPTGDLWMTGREDDRYFLSAVLDPDQKVILPERTVPQDLQFWPKDNYPEDWPAEWQSDLLLALGGPEPMIARAHFKFGRIQAKLTPLITGISNPSTLAGRNHPWGIPTALAFAPDGRLLFFEQVSGSVYTMLRPSSTPSMPDLVIVKEPKQIKASTQTAKKPQVLRGSSIQSASSLNKGSMIESDELLKAEKQDAEPLPDPEDRP